MRSLQCATWVQAERKPLQLVIVVAAILFPCLSFAQLPPNSPSYHWNLARKALKSENYSEAIHELGNALKLTDEGDLVNRSAGHILRASAYHSLGKWQECCDDASAAIRLMPQNIQGHLLLASALKERGRIEQALVAIDAALALDANSPPARFIKAEIYMLREEYRKAEEDFSVVISGESDNSWAFFRRASARFELGKYDNALGDLNRAIALDSENAYYFFARSLCNQKLGNDKKAKDDSRKAAKLLTKSGAAEPPAAGDIGRTE